MTKIYNVINEQYAVYDCDNNCFVNDVSRDDDDYISVVFSRSLKIDEIPDYVSELIRNEDCYADMDGSVDVYEAVLDSGESFKVYVW